MSSPASFDDSARASTLPTRRTVSKGAAWAVPTLVVGSLAHAAAASPCSPATNPRGCPTPSGVLTVRDNGNTFTANFTLAIAGTTTQTSIGQTTLSGFFRYPNLTFTSSGTGSPSGWSNLTRVPGGQVVIGGVTYYQYSTTLASASPVAGTTNFATPTFNSSAFTSVGKPETAVFRRETLINDLPQTATSGVFSIV